MQELLDRQKLKNESFDNLCDLKNILDQMGIPFWLDAGILLGLHREGDIIKGDEDDTDICMWKEYSDKIPQVISKLQEVGFELLNNWQFKGSAEGVAVKRGGNKIDIIMMRKVKKDNKDYVFHLANNDKKRLGDLPYYAFVFSAEIYSSFERIKWRDVLFPCPHNIEGYLTERYGDWKVPVRRGEGYKLFNLSLNPCLKGDWDYTL